MFELYQSEKTEKYHFRLKAKNGEIILTGQGYKDKSSCENGIESVRKNAADESKFEVKESSNADKKYFVLKAGNGQVIGQSQMYKSDSGLKNGMKSVATNCSGDCKDLTA